MNDRSLPGFRAVKRWPPIVVGLLLLVALLMPPPASTQAQIGGSIGYGSSVFGTISAPGGLLTYSFNGNASDLVEIRVHHWTGTFDPQISLAAPNGQPIASSSTDPFSDDPLAATLALVLPQTGIYSLKVGGDQNTTGDFVLKLHGRSAVAAQPLAFGQSVDVTIPVNPTPQYFSFEAQTCPTVLTAMNLSTGSPFTFPYYVSVRDAQGIEIAQWMGGDALEDRLTVAPLSGRYEVLVSSMDPAVQGMIRLMVTCADQAPGCIPGSSMAAGGPAGRSTPCPPCFSDDFEGELCDRFEVAVTLDGTTATFTWPPVDGAQYYIFSIIDSANTLLGDSPRLLEGATSHSYTFAAEDLARGPFRAIVNAGYEVEGYLCTDEVEVDVEMQPDPDNVGVCELISVGAEIVPGEERIVVVYWDTGPGAAAYVIHIYASSDDGSLIGIRVIVAPGDANTFHLDGLFPADYDDFHIEVGAYSEATGGGAFGDMPTGYLCSGSTDVEFGPLGPVQWQLQHVPWSQEEAES